MIIASTLILYIFTLGLAALIPGPGMTALLLKTLTSHYRNGLVMLLGLITGDLCYLMIALFGISTITNLLNGKFALIFICCACAYLYYVAFTLWQTKADLFILSNIKHPPNQPKLFFLDYFNGLSLTLSNPKTMTFYLALVPSIFGSSFTISYSSVMVMITLTIIILLLVGGLYIFSAIKMKRFLSTKSNQQRLLKAIALILASLATYMLLSKMIHLN
mgnify:FL=1